MAATAPAPSPARDLSNPADMAVGSLIRRKTGNRAIGRIVRIWTAPAHRDYHTYTAIPERRMALVAWPSRRMGSESGEQRSAIQLSALVEVVR